MKNKIHEDLNKFIECWAYIKEKIKNANMKRGIGINIYEEESCGRRSLVSLYF